jgi:hypothetical protein
MADTEHSAASPARPGELPIDLAAELHSKGPDAVAVACCQLLTQLGADAAGGSADSPPAGQPR